MSESVSFHLKLQSKLQPEVLHPLLMLKSQAHFDFELCYPRYEFT